jgi:hypothetical protein
MGRADPTRAAIFVVPRTWKTLDVSHRFHWKSRHHDLIEAALQAHQSPGLDDLPLYPWCVVDLDC